MKARKVQKLVPFADRVPILQLPVEPHQDPALLRIEEFAAAVGVGEATVRAWVKAGKVYSIPLGLTERVRRIPAGEVERIRNLGNLQNPRP